MERIELTHKLYGTKVFEFSEATGIGHLQQSIEKYLQSCEEAFADELGISVSAYKKLESGENGISTKRLRQLKTMDISSDFILYGDRGHIEKLKFDVDNGSEIDKIGIMLQLILER